MPWTKGNWRYTLVVALFLASGLSSLIYQVVWTRMLVLVFGSTTYATATVLAIFMGGLALGAWLAGRVADRLNNQFLWYGVLEGFIGVWALLAPLLFSGAEHLYQIIYPVCHNQPALFSLIRFALAAIILLPPTTCMGASLPLLAKYVTTSLDEVGSRTGTLYSINTLGAIVGAGLAGFILLPQCGLHQTILIAAVINFLLFLAVIPASSTKLSWAAFFTLTDSDEKDKQTTKSSPLPIELKLAIACFAASGGVAMIYEVCWTRALLLMVGSSTYAFTIMLCAFLIGIFLGSMICSKLIDRISQPLLLFSLLQLAAALLAAAGTYEFIYLPYVNIHLYLMSLNNASWYLLTKAILCGALLVPLTLCLGATFPAVVKGCTQDLARIGRSTGDIYTANTIGAIAGAFLAGFVFIPNAGVEKTLIGAVAASGVIGVASLWNCGWSNKRTRAVACAATAICIGWWLWLPTPWDPVIMAFAQVNRRHLDAGMTLPNYETWRKALRDRTKLVYYKDGACSSVAVLEFGTDKHPLRSLITNGHVDGSDTGDTPTQSLVAAFPLLLKPNADDVAVIGWGVGMSVGTATLFPVKSIDAIELEPAVVQASKWFHRINYAPETNPKVHIQYNDGRNYLLATNKYYDVIISEPSNPWQSGVCNLFTTQYFRACQKRLKPGGIFSLWVQLAEVSPDNVRGILKSLKECFPYTAVMSLGPANISVLASASPLTINPADLQNVLQIKEVRNELSNYRLDSVEAVLARLSITGQGVDRLIEGATANTDDRNALEFSVGRSYETQTFRQLNLKLIPDSGSRPWEQIALSHLSAQGLAQAASLVATEAARTNFDIASKWAELSLRTPTRQGLSIATQLNLPIATFEAAEKKCTELLAKQPHNVDALATRGLARLACDKFADARSDFALALQLQPNDKTLQYYTAYTYCGGHLGTGDFAPQTVRKTIPSRESAVMTLKYCEPLLKDHDFISDYPKLLFLSADAYHRLGNDERALALMNQYRKIAPESAGACRLMGDICSSLGQRMEGTAYLQRSFQLGRSESATILARLPAGAGTDERLRQYSAVMEIDPFNPDVVDALKAMHDPRAQQLLDKAHLN
jgi:spermidine synthase